MMSFLKSKVFRMTFLALILLELLSFVGWARPEVGSLLTVLILVFVLVISLHDLRYGVAIAFTELIVGSHGYLFSLGAGGLSLSLRLGIFLCLMAVSFVQILREKKIHLMRSQLFYPFLILGFFVLLAVGVGVLRHHGFADVFFDANAYLYFLLAIPIWQAIRTRADIQLFLEAGFAGLLVQTAKVFFLEYAFSHKLWWMLQEVYRWVRDTRIGEITIQYDGPFHRVFFQSHLYTLISLFLFVLAAVAISKQVGLKRALRMKKYLALIGLSVVVFASTLISLSRSNWIGIAAAGILLPAFLFLSEGEWFKKTISVVLHGLLITAMSIVLVAGIVLFPFPRTEGGFDSSLFSKRALTFKDEAGVSSRWQLLPPLWEEIKQHPVLGSGFGQTVTYITADPRILDQNPSGEYTTYSLEWGYLELWLKLGALGLVAYAYLLFWILKMSISLLHASRQQSYTDNDRLLLQTLALGGIAMLVIHFFSPYLNHPLGIGYLLFWGVMVEQLSRKDRRFSEKN